MAMFGVCVERTSAGTGERRVRDLANAQHHGDRALLGDSEPLDSEKVSCSSGQIELRIGHASISLCASTREYILFVEAQGVTARRVAAWVRISSRKWSKDVVSWARIRYQGDCR